MAKDLTIADALPTLPAEQLKRLLPGDLSAESPLDRLVQFGNRRVFDSLARSLLDFRGDVPLGTSLPGLLSVRDDLVAEGTLSRRPHNILRRFKRGDWYSWGDIASMTPNALLSLQNFGMKSAVEVVGVSARQALLSIATDQGPAVAVREAARREMDGRHEGLRGSVSSGGECVSAARPSALRSLVTITRWLHVATEASTFEEGIRLLLDTAELPPDVEAAWRDLRSSPLADLVEAGGEPSLGEFVAAIDGIFANDRARAVFWARLAPAPPTPTLEELAQQWGLTRERVRQLNVKAGQEVREALVRPEFALLRWRVHALRHRLGLGFLPGSEWAVVTIQRALEGTRSAEMERARELVLWLAGPYRSDAKGWLSRGAIPGRDAVHEAVEETSSRVNVELLTDLLVEAGLVAEAAGDWMATYLPTRVIGDVHHLWEGSVADKAYVLLSAHGRPLTAEHVAAEIGEGHGVRSTRGRLLDDPRFKRVDRTRIGLEHWDLDEYTGIVDEIAQEIERRGGEAELRDVVSTVSAEYDLRVASVESYATVPRFIIENNRIRLRRPDEPYQPRRTLVEEPHCYVLDDSHCSYRLLIDREVLRGSGRPIPEGLGAWLGVLPGIRRSFVFGEGEVPVTWPDSALFGPSIGSLRRIVTAQGGEVGDQLLILFDREHSRALALVVRDADLNAATGDEQIIMLTGVSADAIEQALAAAVGADPDIGLKERLRRRGESRLLRLVAGRTSQLDDALDRLRDVL